MLIDLPTKVCALKFLLRGLLNLSLRPENLVIMTTERRAFFRLLLYLFVVMTEVGEKDASQRGWRGAGNVLSFPLAFVEQGE